MPNSFGYLQHAARPAGPFKTEQVYAKCEFGDKWLAFFEGKWRRVHVQVNRTYIVCLGERITIQIEGL